MKLITLIGCFYILENIYSQDSLNERTVESPNATYILTPRECSQFCFNNAQCVEDLTRQGKCFVDPPTVVSHPPVRRRDAAAADGGRKRRSTGANPFLTLKPQYIVLLGVGIGCVGMFAVCLTILCLFKLGATNTTIGTGYITETRVSANRASGHYPGDYGDRNAMEMYDEDGGDDVRYSRGKY